MAQNRLQALLHLLFPPRCLFCRSYLEQEEQQLCEDCRTKFPATGKQARREGRSFRFCLSPLFYTELFKGSFHRYKFRSHWHYSKLYGEWMWECVQREGLQPEAFDLISWAPLSRQRWCSRGYDQSKLLAKELSRYSELPLVPLLHKWKHIAPQSGTNSPEKRRTNIQGVYRLRHGADVAGKHILLVDDIITTGSTLEEVSRVLMEGGAAEVCCLTLARSKYTPD